MASRGGKRMKKRRELDALVANGKSGSPGARFESPGTGSYCSSDAEDGTGPEGGLLFAEARGRTSRSRRGRGPLSGALRVGCAAFFIMGSLLAAAALTWLLADVRAQVAALRAHLDRVSSSSDGVSTELYQCRSNSRQLQLNQSHLAGQLENLTAHLNNITIELHGVAAGLVEVQKRVKEAPQLVAVPKQLSDLSTSVANLGSQIQDLRTTTTQLQSQSSNAVTNITQLQVSVVSLNATAQALSATQSGAGNSNKEKITDAAQAEKEAIIQKLQDQLSVLSTNLTQVNTSLNGRLQWTRDDINKHHKSIEALQESGQNVSARLTTLEGQCSAAGASQESLEKNITQLNSQVSGTSSRTAQLETRVGQLQNLYRELQAQQANIQGRLENPEPQLTSVAPSPSAVVTAQSPTAKLPAAAAATVPSQPLVSASASTTMTLAAEG